MTDCIFWLYFIRVAGKSFKEQHNESHSDPVQVQTSVWKGDPLNVFSPSSEEVISRKETKIFQVPDQIKKTMEEFPN